MGAVIIGSGYAGLSSCDRLKLKQVYEDLVVVGGFDHPFEKFIDILEAKNEYLRPETVTLPFMISERFKETANSIREFGKALRSIEKFGSSKHNKAAALRFKSRHKKKR